MELQVQYQDSSLQAKVLQLVEKNWFTRLILTLILLNAVLLGMETSTALMAQYGPLLHSLDRLLLSVFVLELLLRIFAYRLSFFKDAWNLFDFAVIAIALVPASGPLAVLRSLRVLRVLRVLSMVPSMKRVVSALLGSLPGLASIAMVLLLIYYVFAVIATKLFGAAFPEWFGSIGRSLYTLFQVMTLESWSMGIARPVMETFPLAWLFFVPFILIATFTMLNLFIAIIVNTMQTFSEEEHAAERAEDKQAEALEQRLLHEELREIRQELKLLRAELSKEQAQK
ncbi:ion transporter [Rheinheimera sp. 4Y26]|uniref:ion transporter n=1 Tax=Rheinheimera sp. 4Y26 TaxID=2977811 RepID=UPI0021B0A947|nr:ion transporter [Rheinheimera sp. 4Y26]MCT6698113.1 ion transporter [Rheinheimera sp. 4Y26]